MEKKFGVLRFIGSVYKIVGIIVAVLTILSALASCLLPVLGGAVAGRVEQQLGARVANNVVAGLFVGASIVVSGGILAVTLYATGQGIFLILAIEENTRATALYLRRPVEVPAAVAAPAPGTVPPPIEE